MPKVKTTRNSSRGQALWTVRTVSDICVSKTYDHLEISVVVVIKKLDIYLFFSLRGCLGMMV